MSETVAPLVFDPSRLPERALVDTNVLIRFLGERTDDKSAACVAFCNAMLDARKALLVAAPTIAEIARKKGAPVPRTAGLEAVPFDRKAADLLGLNIPYATLIELKTGDPKQRPLHYWKYDSLILACAMRWAHCLVTTDDGLLKLAERTGFTARHPADFADAPPPPAPTQQELPFNLAKDDPPAPAEDPEAAAGTVAVGGDGAGSTKVVPPQEDQAPPTPGDPTGETTPSRPPRESVPELTDPAPDAG